MNEAGTYAILCRQLAVIMRANVSPLSALEICRDQMENRRIRKVIAGLVSDLSGGDKLSDAMKQRGDKFPMIAIAAVEGAEKSGEWEKPLLNLAGYFEMEARLKENVRRASLTPAIVALLSLVLLSLIMLQVVPRFLGMFNGITYEMPGLTKRVLMVSEFCRNRTMYIFAAVAGLILLRFLILLSRGGRSLYDTLKMHLPLTGGISRNLLNAQFSKALSTLLENGMPIQEAARVIEDSVGSNERVRGELQHVAERVAEGMSLSKALADSSVFSKMVLQMSAIGEESGTLSVILSDMADYFERNTVRLAHRKAIILETVFVILLCLVMTVALTAMVQPMMEFYDMIGGM